MPAARAMTVIVRVVVVWMVGHEGPFQVRPV
jgi:hypothetical protein